MEPYLIPSVTAICFKIVIFLRYHESLRRENFNLCLLFVAVLLLNLVELIVFERSYSHSTTLLLLIAYYCCAVFSAHAYINIALQYSKFSWHAGIIKGVLNVALAGLTLALIFDRGIIADWTMGMGGYAPTKVEGSRYWIVQLCLFVGMGFAVGLLNRGMRKLESNLARRQCLLFLFASIAPVLMTVLVVILQEQGVPISAGIFMSMAFTLMLAIIVYAEEKSRLFRLLTLVPFSSERKLHRQLLHDITKCVSISDTPGPGEDLDLKGMMKSLEGTVVEHVLNYYDGNQKLAASALGVSEATISRRARGGAKQSGRSTGENRFPDQASVRITQ